MNARAVTAVAALAVLTGGCGGRPAPKFNPLPSGAASAPAKPAKVVEAGGSDVSLDGEVTLHTERGFQCSTAPDDFFVRGPAGRYDGMDVFLAVNVEFYKGPGDYSKRTQVFIRRLSDDGTWSAAWYGGHADMVVHPGKGGADLEASVLPPEAGSKATKPLKVSGHFSCAGTVRSVPG